MQVVCDIETDSLNATKIWCVVCKDVDTEDEYVFLQDDAEKFKQFSTGVSHWIGHNFLGFDAYYLNLLWGVPIAVDAITDTAVLSRLYNKTWEGYNKKGQQCVRQTRDAHSLESWGLKLGSPKIDFDDYSKYTEAMLDYCKQDVRLNLKVYRVLLGEGKRFSKMSVQLEHTMQWILARQQRSGFKLDVPKARELLSHCAWEANRIEQEILVDFPPIAVLINTYTPRYNKDGITLNRPSLGPMRDELDTYYSGGAYSLIKWEPFNLRSSTQKLARLQPYWKPTVRTKTKKSFSVCTENLATIRSDAPQSIKNLALYATYVSRVDTIQSWFDNLDSDNRVRGSVLHIGSWSGRMAHFGPNMANVPGILDKKTNKPLLVGKECRECWVVDDGCVLLGTDASGIQLRVLAHYLNNPKYTAAVLDDLHTFNAGILSCTRPLAKTFVYAWLLGQGVVATSELFGCSVGEAHYKREAFVRLTPGLKEFMVEKHAAANMGYFRGLDGRIVYVPNDHLALTAYLQNGEGVIMRMTNVLWDRWARQRGIKFKQCAMVHDEWQVQVEKDRAVELGELQRKAFRQAGKLLKLNVPIDGEYVIGQNWAQTH